MHGTGYMVAKGWGSPGLPDFLIVDHCIVFARRGRRVGSKGELLCILTLGILGRSGNHSAHRFEKIRHRNTEAALSLNAIQLGVD